MTHHHKHHITPLCVYLAIGGALLFLTVVTVLVSFVNLNEITGIHTMNFIVAMIIATTKATLVALFFMHLIYDNKFYLFTLLAGILCLMIFIVITMFDTEFRGQVNPDEGRPIVEQVPSDRFIERAHHEDHSSETHSETTTHAE